MYSKEETVKVMPLGVIIATSLSSLLVFLLSVWQAEALLGWEMEQVLATAKNGVFFNFLLDPLIPTFVAVQYLLKEQTCKCRRGNLCFMTCIAFCTKACAFWEK